MMVGAVGTFLPGSSGPDRIHQSMAAPGRTQTGETEHKGLPDDLNPIRHVPLGLDLNVCQLRSLRWRADVDVGSYLAG